MSRGKAAQAATTSPEKKFSFLGLVFGVIVTAMGSAVLSLPSSAREIGPWPAVFVLILVAVINSEVAKLTAETCATLENLDHPDEQYCEGEADEPLLDRNHHRGQVTAAEESQPCDAFDSPEPQHGEQDATSVRDEIKNPASSGNREDKPVLVVNSYAKYLGIVFERERAVLVIARLATYVGYFALMLVVDILYGSIFLQAVEQIKWTPVGGGLPDTWHLKLYFSCLVLFPLHVWQSVSSDQARTFVTATLAEGVPYLSVLIVALVFYELWLQHTGDHSDILSWLEEQREQQVEEVHEQQVRQEPAAQERPPSTSQQSLSSSARTATPSALSNNSWRGTQSQSFPAAWHSRGGLLQLKIGLGGGHENELRTSDVADICLTFLRVAAFQSYGFMTMTALISASFASSLVTTLRGRAKRPEQMASAHRAAVLLEVVVFSSIILYGYHVFGNATPDLLTDGFRRNREQEHEHDAEDGILNRAPWFLRVYGYSESEQTRNAATSPQHCTGHRQEVAEARDLFTQNWPQNRERNALRAEEDAMPMATNGRPIEWYSPWTMGEPTWGCSLVINLLVGFCLFVTDMLYTVNFFATSSSSSSAASDSEWDKRTSSKLSAKPGEHEDVVVVAGAAEAEPEESYSTSERYEEQEEKQQVLQLLKNDDDVSDVARSGASSKRPSITTGGKVNSCGDRDGGGTRTRPRTDPTPLCSSWSSTYVTAYLWPVVVALLRVLCALVVPHIVEVVGLVSSVCLVLTEILFPLVGYYKVVVGRQRQRRGRAAGTNKAVGGVPAQIHLLLRRILHMFIFIFGVLMLVLATYAGVVRLVQKITADQNNFEQEEQEDTHTQDNLPEHLYVTKGPYMVPRQQRKVPVCNERSPVGT